MAITYPGQIFKSAPGQEIAKTAKLLPADTSSNEPLGGMLSVLISGKMQYQITTTSTGATQNLTAICVEGKHSYDAYHKPGRVASSGDTLGYAAFGGNGATYGNNNPSNTRLKNFIPLAVGDKWVMDRKDATAVTIGTAYGYDLTTSVPTVDAGNTTNTALYVVGYYEPDLTAGLAATAARVWVTAKNPNGYLVAG